MVKYVVYGNKTNIVKIGMILKDKNSKSSNSLYYWQKWTKRSSENKKGIYIYIFICISMYKELQLVAGKQKNLLCSLKILPFHCDKAVSLGGGQLHLYFQPPDSLRCSAALDLNWRHRPQAPLKQLCTPHEVAPMKGVAARMTDRKEGPTLRLNGHCLVWCWQLGEGGGSETGKNPGEEL